MGSTGLVFRKETVLKQNNMIRDYKEAALVKC